MLDLAGGRKHQVLGAVVVRHVVHERRPRHRRHDLRRPEDRAPERLARIRGLLEQIEHQVVRRVLHLPDLLQDHGALARELALVEGRVLQDVGEQVDRERQIVREHARVVGGLLARGVGVQVAADVLDRLGDSARRAALGALERHVLEHVGDAVDLGRLVARADVDPDADAHRLHARHGLGRDAQAAIEGGDLRGLAHAVSMTSSWMWRCTAAQIVRQDGAALGPLVQIREALRQLPAGRRSPCAPHRGTSPDGRSRARPAGSSDRAGRRARRGCRPRCAGRPAAPVACQHVGHRRRGLVLVDPRGVEQLARAGRGHRPARAGCRCGEVGQQTRDLGAVAARTGRTAGARSCSRPGCPCSGSWSARPCPRCSVPLAKKRARMSLRLVATISCAIGRPILCAT